MNSMNSWILWILTLQCEDEGMLFPQSVSCESKFSCEPDVDFGWRWFHTDYTYKASTMGFVVYIKSRVVKAFTHWLHSQVF